MAPLSNSSRVLFISPVTSNTHESEICEYLQKASPSSIVHIVKRFYLFKPNALLVEFSTHEEAASVVSALGNSFQLTLDGTQHSFKIEFSRRDTIGNTPAPTQHSTFSLTITVEAAPGVAITPRWIEKVLRDNNIEFSLLHPGRVSNTFVVKFTDSSALDAALEKETIQVTNPSATLQFVKSNRRKPTTRDTDDASVPKSRVDTPWSKPKASAESCWCDNTIVELNNLNADYFRIPDLIYILANLRGSVSAVKTTATPGQAFVKFEDPQTAKAFVEYANGLTLFACSITAAISKSNNIKTAGNWNIADETEGASTGLFKKYLTHSSKRSDPSPVIYVGAIPTNVNFEDFNIPASLLKNKIVKQPQDKDKFALIELVDEVSAVEAAIMIYDACLTQNSSSKPVRISFSERKTLGPVTDAPKKQHNQPQTPSDVEETFETETPVTESAATQVDETDDNWF